MAETFWSADSPVEIAPDFERLRTALLCQQADRVPLLELFHDLDVKEAFLGRSIRCAKDDIAFHVNAGYDYYTFGFQYEEMIHAYNQIGIPSSGPATPLYQKTAPRHWVPERDGIIANRTDFDNFIWPTPGRSPILAMANVFDHLSGDQAVRESLEFLPETMKLIYQTDGIFERFTKLMGLESMSYCIQDDPALVEEMFAISGRLAVGLFEYMAGLPGIGALWLADDLAYASGLLVSPDLLRRHLFPWYRKIAEIARGAGCPLLFHSDGNLLDILDELVDIGFNALQPIEPKAMDIRSLKEKYHGRLCLVGNIDLGSTLTLGSVSDVHAEVLHRIEQIGPGGGYCVGSSNTVTNYVPLENFKAMVEATFVYGRYATSKTTEIH
jgi:uroporphyrinogen decarboxylase